MGKVSEHTVGIGTVAELIRVLEQFPGDMPINVDGGDMAEVFLLTPEDGEEFADERGEVHIGEDLGLGDVAD